MYGYPNQPYQAYAPYYAQPMPDQLAQPMRIVDYTERSQAARMPQNAMNVPAQEYVTREEFAALVARVDEYGTKKTKKKESEEVENG